MNLTEIIPSNEGARRVPYLVIIRNPQQGKAYPETILTPLHIL